MTNTQKELLRQQIYLAVLPDLVKKHLSGLELTKTIDEVVSMADQIACDSVHQLNGVTHEGIYLSDESEGVQL